MTRASIKRAAPHRAALFVFGGLVYTFVMTNIAQTIDRLARALEALPVQTQADILADLETRVEQLRWHFGQTNEQESRRSPLPEEQRRVVVERLALPREYAPQTEVTALLQRFQQHQ